MDSEFVPRRTSGLSTVQIVRFLQFGLAVRSVLAAALLAGALREGLEGAAAEVAAE